MTWHSTDDPPDNGRTVCIIKKSSLKGAVTIGLDFRFNGQWYNATRDGYQVLKWQEAPKYDVE